MKKYFFGLITGILLVSGVTVLASTLVSGSDVSYDNTTTGLSSTNVKDALDELYEIAETHCPSGYECKEKAACDYEEGYVWEFAYTGLETTFTIPCSGKYKLEVYGAQGGTAGGAGYIANGANGAYVSATYDVSIDTKLYINVGGKGGTSTPGWDTSCTSGAGGYNGGGAGSCDHTNNYYRSSAGGGGGATSISLESGLISVVTPIVAAGGGGGGYSSNAGGTSWEDYTSAGSTAYQSNGVRGLGTAASNSVTNSRVSAGGGGYYGGSRGYTGTNYAADYVSDVTVTQGANSGAGKATITLISY